MKITFSFLSALFASTGFLFADHGPGTSGGGASTLSGETLKPGKFSIETRWDFTEFQSLSAADTARKAQKAGSIDLLNHSSIYGISIGYGVVQNFQVGLSIGYYDASGSREAESETDESGDTASTRQRKKSAVNYSHSNPDGLTDLLLTGKYRVYRGPIGQFSLLGGVKIPTGRSDVNNDLGESVEPSATAGSGAWDFVVGGAYTRNLTPQLSLDVSALYTIRTEAKDFRLGNRFDAGLALAYRLIEDIERYPQLGVFVEANLRHLAKSQDAGEIDPNTGGTALFVSPGLRVGFNKRVSLTVAGQLPVIQNLNGEQLETRFRVLAAFNITF